MKQHKPLRSMFKGYYKQIILPVSTAFSGDNCNILFGGVTLASTKNVFAKLKVLLNQRQVNRCELPCTYPK
jgi:hypothetical protein